jgi:hypothetical protein
MCPMKGSLEGSQVLTGEALAALTEWVSRH